MYLLLKFLRKFVKIFNSLAAPWQVFLGTLFGTLLGFMPIISFSNGPAALGCAILLLALIVNCHLGSVFLFLAVGKLLSLLLAGPAVLVGEQVAWLAQSSADIGVLRASLWNHTGHLGMTIIGLVLAPLFATAMWRATVVFRTRLRDQLLARKRLVSTGKMVSNPLLVRAACWFFDV